MTIGFCHFLRRLADKFPTPPIIIAIDSPVDVGPSMQQLLEEKEAALMDATSKIDNLDREKAGLRAKVSRLEAEVDFVTKDRYKLVREKITLENRLGDFNSWPEFRIEFDRLTTEFIAMKSQRAREHLLQERYLESAKEARAELAAAKQAETMSKEAHSKELELAQQERDEAMEKYRILLATQTTTSATAAATTTTPPTAAAIATTTSPAANAAAAAIPVVKGNSPGDSVLQSENTRLTLALRSQSSLLAKKTSDLGRMQSLLKTRSDHSAAQLEKATSTIASLEEDKAKAEARIEELGRDLQKAKDEAEQMEEMYMAVAFPSEDEGEQVDEGKDEVVEDNEEEEEGDDGSDEGGDSDDDDDDDDDNGDDEEEDGGGAWEDEEGDEDSE